MNILSFPTGPFATNMYVICCNETSDAVIVDPGVGSYEMVQEVLGQHTLRPTAIWLTHSHWDHIVDAAKIQRELSLPIYIHEEDVGNLLNPSSDGVPIPVPAIEGTTPDHLIKEGDFLKVGNGSFKVIHTPGHTPGGICFYNEKEKKLLCGDTFYRGLIGSLTLPTSRPKLIWESLKKIAALPPDTLVFPGHGPSTTIKEESWLHNPKEKGIVHQ